MHQKPSIQSNFIVHQAPQVVIDNNTLDVMNKSSNAVNIEKRIESFKWYTILVIIQAALAIASLSFYIRVHVDVGDIVLAVASTTTTFTACIIARIAKSRLNSGRQSLAFQMFCLSTFLNLVTTIVSIVIIKDKANNLGQENLTGDPDDQALYDVVTSDAVSAIAIALIPIQFLVGVTLIYGSRVLSKLIDERTNILLNINMKTVL